MLTEAGCLERQRRLREQLERQNIDAVVLTDYRDVYYLTGILLTDRVPGGRFPVYLFLETKGGAWLVGDTCVESACVDECLTYEWNVEGTNTPHLLDQLNEVIERRLRGMPAVRRVGWQSESMAHRLRATTEAALHPDDWIAVDDLLADMQRRKDPDEVATIRRCIEVDLAGYTAARAMIAPGVTELAVLAAGQRGAMMEAGEPIYHGGDYRCGVFNGPARPRQIQRDEIYIIDAQSYYQGYWSDLSRAYSVSREPTPLQQSIFDHVAAVQRAVPSLLKPGVDGTEVYHALDHMIREHPALAESGLWHHGGHGIGLRLHEMPDINRDRGGLFEVGNVISVEPGGYTDEARYGARIENMYLITESGAVNLSEYPVALV